MLLPVGAVGDDDTWAASEISKGVEFRLVLSVAGVVVVFRFLGDENSFVVGQIGSSPSSDTT